MGPAALLQGWREASTMMRNPAPTMFAVSLMLLSGCLVGSHAATVPTPSRATVASADQGSGTLEGTVTDPEIVPVAEAKVQALLGKDSPPLVVFTDPAGHFRIEGVPVATVTVYASKPGFRDVTKQVSVQSEAPTTVKLVLEPSAALAPFHETLHYGMSASYALCAMAADQLRCTNGMSTVNRTYSVRIDESAYGPLHSFIVETQWTPKHDACTGGFRTDVYSPDQLQVVLPEDATSGPQRSASNPYHWENKRVGPPTYLQIPREGDATAMLSPERTQLNAGKPIKTSGIWRIQGYPAPVGVTGLPVDVSCQIQPAFTVWATYFYVAPAPSPTWSILTEGT